MKKTLFLILSLLFVMICVFADPTPGKVSATIGPGSDSDNTDGLQVSLNATFDMKDESNKCVTIGFIDNADEIPANAGEDVNEAQSITLKPDATSGTAKYGKAFESTYLALFYQIQYDDQIDVVLTFGGDLEYKVTGTAGGDTTHKLGWTLKEGGNSLSSPSVKGDGNKENITVTVHNPDTDGFSSVGVKELSIETDSYVDSTPGNYTGSIIATIDVV